LDQRGVEALEPVAVVAQARVGEEVRSLRRAKQSIIKCITVIYLVYDLSV
jgi:hypothetical protein